jgi:hypothetical protein
MACAISSLLNTKASYKMDAPEHKAPFNSGRASPFNRLSRPLFKAYPAALQKNLSGQ